MNADVVSAVDANAMRMVSDGIPYRDLDFLKRDIADIDQWCARWVALSQVYEAEAGRAEANGGTLTAGEQLWRAALCCHFGQGILMNVTPAEKAAADVRKQQLFRRAATLLQPALERITIPFEGKSLPGYLRLAPGSKPGPCMVVFGGLDTTKEDALELTNYFVARGVSTLTFDGPGQGEMFATQKMRLDYEAAVSAVIDYACTRPEIDHNRIGVIGRSTGGHWSVKTAATDPRVKVAIAWGLIFHLRDFDNLSPSLHKRFMRAASIDTMDEARTFFHGYDLTGYAEKVHCPLMVVQGGRDPIAPPESLALLQRAMPQAPEIVCYEQSGHCAHDLAHLFKPVMADFAARHLRA